MHREGDFIEQAFQAATKWAREILARDPSTVVIFDTETTGLSGHDEIIQFGAIDAAGNVLLDNVIIRPTVEITREAEAVHGISNDTITSYPMFPEIMGRLGEVLGGKLVLIYNADFDLRMLRQTEKAHSVQAIEYIPMGINAECVMLKYAQWMGEWNDFRGSFRWQKLPAGDHSALGDCRATLDVIRKMAKGDEILNTVFE